MADWQDTFDGSALNAKWMDYDIGSGSVAVVDGRLVFTAPKDGDKPSAIILGLGMDFSLPCSMCARLFFDAYETGAGDDLMLQVFHTGGIVAGFKNGIGVTFKNGGTIMARSWDADRTRTNGNAVSITGAEIIARIDFDAEGGVSFAFKEPDDQAWTTLNTPSPVTVMDCETVDVAISINMASTTGGILTCGADYLLAALPHEASTPPKRMWAGFMARAFHGFKGW